MKIRKKWWEPTRSFSEIVKEYDRDENDSKRHQHIPLNYLGINETLSEVINRIKKNNYQYVSARDAKRLIDELEK